MAEGGRIGKIGVTIVLVVVALAGCTTPGQDGNASKTELKSRVTELESRVQNLQDRVAELKDQLPPETGLDVVVKQEPGNTVYWVLPGPRELSPTVFGSQQQPRTTGQWQIQALNASEKPGSDKIAEILKTKLPFLVGAPPKATEVVNGTRTFTAPTPFSDKAVPGVEGSLRVAYRDRQPSDGQGPPTQTDDEAELNVTFSDPDGNDYRVELVALFQAPIPGYQTAGGVMTNAWHHGITGTGSPLMPRTYTYGAFWALGNVYVNGTLTEKRHFFHFMTTEIVRNADYELAIDEEMPIPPSDAPVTGQTHHTHGIVLPFEVTENGPAFDPVDTAFTLPNGRNQPFIHVMFEEDCITTGPYADSAC